MKEKEGKNQPRSTIWPTASRCGQFFRRVNAVPTRGRYFPPRKRRVDFAASLRGAVLEVSFKHGLRQFPFSPVTVIRCENLEILIFCSRMFCLRGMLEYPGVFVLSPMFPSSHCSSSGCFTDIRIFASFISAFSSVNEVAEVVLVDFVFDVKSGGEFCSRLDNPAF